MAVYCKCLCKMTRPFSQFQFTSEARETSSRSVHRRNQPQCDTPLLARVKKCFEKRKMWTRPGIILEVHDILHAHWWLQRVLQAVSYSWKNGPFKDAYCVLGYDPREAPEGAAFQTIDFRDKELNEKLGSVRVLH